LILCFILSFLISSGGSNASLTYAGSLDQIMQVIDPVGATTQYTSDALGDTMSTQSGDTGTTTRTFDAAGNMLTATDARGAKTSYTYDALNRLILPGLVM
jgi:uncharacterized protein RhaS with RHS repeats